MAVENLVELSLTHFNIEMTTSTIPTYKYRYIKLIILLLFLTAKQQLVNLVAVTQAGVEWGALVGEGQAPVRVGEVVVEGAPRHGQPGGPQSSRLPGCRLLIKGQTLNIIVVHCSWI